jgi:folate-dependent tRNA-U54 methylase TrmFO/GidA
MTPEFKKKFEIVETPMTKEEYEEFIDALAKLCTRLYLRKKTNGIEQSYDEIEATKGRDEKQEVG